MENYDDLKITIFRLKVCDAIFSFLKFSVDEISHLIKNYDFDITSWLKEISLCIEFFGYQSNAQIALKLTKNNFGPCIPIK